MAPRAIPPILASGLAQLLMLLLVQVVVLAGSLIGPPPALATEAITTPLTQRSDAWPQWSLPAPLEQPGRRDLTYPVWFAGTWQVHSDAPDYTVRFGANGSGAIVGDRAFNAQAIGSALLGAQLQGVRNDPANPNRQLALLSPQQGLTLTLESTVVGRRQQQPTATSFEADELALQVLHGPGDPRISRVETLSRYALQADGRITADQWQATYPSPALGLKAQATNTAHNQLVLERVSLPSPRPGSDPAS
jgi:hypothetical protein